MTPSRLVEVCVEIIRRLDPSMKDVVFDIDSEDGKFMRSFCTELLKVLRPERSIPTSINTIADLEDVLSQWPPEFPVQVNYVTFVTDRISSVRLIDGVVTIVSVSTNLQYLKELTGDELDSTGL
jgi:hypothetical protein